MPSFAIALTLLVIDIKVPLNEEGGSAEILLDELPSIYAYALSFYVIAVNWMGHHRRFAHIHALRRPTDRTQLPAAVHRSRSCRSRRA